MTILALPRIARPVSFALATLGLASLPFGAATALADAPGVEIPAAILRSSEGDAFAFRTKKAFTARPDGFYQAFLTDTEVVVYDREYGNVEVTFVGHCRNYDGVPFTAHLACRAAYDGAHDRWVAKLDAAACTSTDPSYHTSFNFNQAGVRNGWYVSGRTGYYQSQSCVAKVAVRIDGRWLVDPVNGTNDFAPQLDLSWTPDALFNP